MLHRQAFLKIWCVCSHKYVVLVALPSHFGPVRPSRYLEVFSSKVVLMQSKGMICVIILQKFTRGSEDLYTWLWRKHHAPPLFVDSGREHTLVVEKCWDSVGGCSSRGSSLFGWLKTRHAAVFWIICRGLVALAGRLTNRALW